MIHGMTPEGAFARWSHYEEELRRSRPTFSLLENENIPEPHVRTLVLPRETALRFRANYMLLHNICAELLDLDPGEIILLDLVLAMLEKTKGEAK